MSKSKVAQSEQLSMVIDPHRHLSHFGAEGRACPEGPRGRSPRSAPVAPGSAAAHNACLDQMPGGPLGEPTQQLRSVHILPSTRQQLLDLQGRGHPFEFGAQIVEKQQLDVHDRWQSVAGPRLLTITILITINRNGNFVALYGGDRSDLLEPFNPNPVRQLHDHGLAIGQLGEATVPPLGIPYGCIPMFFGADVDTIPRVVRSAPVRFSLACATLAPAAASRLPRSPSQYLPLAAPL